MAEIAIRLLRLPHGAGLPLPSYATAHAAGLDVVAAEELTLAPGARAAIATGFAIAIPEGFEVQVRPRSGLALKHGITCLNTPGTIDADYRGEVKVILANLGAEPFEVRRGERVAQLVPAAVQRATFTEVDVLDETVRGSGGFGSTGAVSLSDEQLDRYARHIVLKEIGGAGQHRLLGARVALIGAGGIGSPAIQYLAAAGVGRLRVIDDDLVALSNLQRQTLFGTADIGAKKASVAAMAVERLNPDVTVEAQAVRFTDANAHALLEGVDVLLDGSDSFATRLLAADIAHARHIPLVSAAVGQFDGQLGVYRGWEAGKPCYRCLVGDAPDRPDMSCADQGVLGALTGLMGALAAIEAIRAIVPFGADPAGSLLLVDALAFRFRTIAVPKDPGCRCAG